MIRALQALATFIFAILTVPTAYLYLLAWASTRRTNHPPRREAPVTRFLIAVPAHNEANVIGHTVSQLLRVNYPAHMFSVHVVADHCTDETAAVARQAGATAHERQDGPRTGKGGALAWLFSRVLADETWNAVIVFDADTQVHPDFLMTMDARLAEGHQVIQGNHVITNPQDGWFPALTWAMFLVDNRFQNLGRSNLGWSAKNMGDSICFRADILRRLGWGEGLTEDYQLRQQLLLEGIRIAYEPQAQGFGEAAQNWAQARAQRARWLRGTRDANQQFVQSLWREGIQRRDSRMLDGVFQAKLPSYSTLTLLTIFCLALFVIFSLALGQTPHPGLVIAWLVLAVLLFIYPFIGLTLEHAPARAYAAIFAGPFFILWRTWLVLSIRFRRRPMDWVRTAHGRGG